MRLFSGIALSCLCATTIFCTTPSLSQAPTSPDLTADSARQTAVFACKEPRTFNKCIAATVDYLYTARKNQGYADTAYTKNLDYGSTSAAIKASAPPTTMCVAAVAETIVESLNFYFAATSDAKPFSVIPSDSWSKGRRFDIRSYIWENEGPVNARGAGAAFDTFGIGTSIAFSAAKPGDFISLDRSKFRPRVGWDEAETKKFAKKKLIVFEGQEGVWQTSGHSTVFLGYLDKSLKPTLTFTPGRIVGFLYFSSQGSAAPNGGFGFRWAIFRYSVDDAGKPICGNAKLSAPLDCSLDGVDKSSLRIGRLHHPTAWRDDGISKLKAAEEEKVRRELRSLVRSDAKALKKQPDTPLRGLFLPKLRDFILQNEALSSKSIVNQPEASDAINIITIVELEKENLSADMERFNGVTD